MGEKVKLTPFQEDALNRVRIRVPNKEDIVRMSIQEHEYWEGDEYPLNDLTTDEVIRALYVGVEKLYDIGDWIEVRIFGRDEVVKVTGIRENEIAVNGGRQYNEYSVIRKLTTKEVVEMKKDRWWTKRGRGVWELRRGDVLRKLNNIISFETVEVRGMDEEYIYLTDGLKIKHKTTKMDLNYRVLCFVEDREDE